MYPGPVPISFPPCEEDVPPTDEETSKGFCPRLLVSAWLTELTMEIVRAELKTLMKLLMQGLACLFKGSVSAIYYLGIIAVTKEQVKPLMLSKPGFWFHQGAALDLNLSNLKLLSRDKPLTLS